MKTIFLCVASIALVWLLEASDGSLLARSESVATFEVYSVDSTVIAVGSVDEISSLPKVTFREGETVSAVPYVGTPVMLVSSAEMSGGVAFAPKAGGVWMLTNSSQGTAYIGVPWHIYGDGGTLAESIGTSSYGVDSVKGGADRALPRRNALPIAYSGDNWAGNLSKPVTLTVISPNGTETTSAFSGSGVFPFSFDDMGLWKVRLSTSDALLESVLDLYGGFAVSVR